MTPKAATRAQARAPLSPERVFAAAISLADRAGLGALTMRRLADELGVEAMSIYYHVENKDALLDGVVDAIGQRIVAAGATATRDPADDWQAAIRERILIARSVLLDHKWAPELLESRTNISPAMMVWFDQLAGIMVAGGFSYDLVHHAMHALGSRAVGFVQELFDDDDPQSAEDQSMAMLEQYAEMVPNIVAMLSEITHAGDPDTTLGFCDDQFEFEFALDLILDGLERKRQAQ